MAATNIGAAALAAITATFADNVGTLTYAGEDAALNGYVASAFLAGTDHMRMFTEQGLYNGASGFVRYLSASEPAAWSKDDAIIGQVVTLQFTGDTEIHRLRVAGRKSISGAVRLTIATEFEE